MPRRLLVQAQRPEARPEAETWQLVVPYGRWQHPDYGLVDNSRPRVARYHEHFQRGVKRQGDPPGILPFTINHDDARGLSGKIADTRIGERGLEALVRWTPLGVQAIADETFPFISPDLVDEYRDPESGERFADVLAGASLVVRPYFKRLPQVYLEHYHDHPEPTVLWVDAEADEMPDESDLKPSAEAAKSFAEPAAETSDEAKQFAEVMALRERVAQMEFAERRREFDDELGQHTFGEKRKLAPGPRRSLAEALADLPRDVGRKLMEAVKALAFYEPGEQGLGGDAPAAEAPAELSAEAKRYCEQLGVSAEQFRAAGGEA